MLNANVTGYQKGFYYTGNKLFSKFASTIKSSNCDIKIFKPAVEDYLITHSYSNKNLL